MKKLLIVLSMLMLGMSTVGCSNKADNNAESSSVSQSDTVDSVKEDTKNKKGSKETKATTIKLGEDIVAKDIVEFRLDEALWMEEILPSDTSGIYSYHEDVEGDVYFVIQGTVKNISGETIETDHGSLMEIKFNNKYKYEPDTLIEDNDGKGFSYGDVRPLSSGKFLIYVSVPNEVKENYESATLTWSFNDMTDYVALDDVCEFSYELNLK